MKSILNINEYDVVFLSYDEPNADDNWADLLTKIPYAQRIHGVKGSDSAHKAVAKLAKTDRVIVIDADNVLHGDFLNQVVELDGKIDLNQAVISWSSRNIINGLQYGNGGIKCWPRQLMLDMRTHENADIGNIKTQVDFCWHINYIGIDQCYSSIHNNATPHQAWRAGFREGVKMSLDQGSKVNNVSKLWYGNLKRLKIWMMVGMDVPNGIWSILGARQGCFMTHCTDWDHTNVRDFEYLNNYWNEYVKDHKVDVDLITLIEAYGHLLELNQFEIGKPFDEHQSRFFKTFDFNMTRQPSTIKIL